MSLEPIPGTHLFDAAAAQRGYALNRMCYSFNEAKNRKAFSCDEIGYCNQFGLSEVQKAAILNRDVLGLLREGGNIYYLAKFAGILGLGVQDLGALQTGMTVAEFKSKLASYAQYNQAINRRELGNG